ncbi:NUDIX hydrolase [Coraliomargarita parva]|uniref:NUDIX hydrolase n=1 Tax=Coraliomargarita parva TaxID=3014050 RepID=UPI0022B47B0B|nr:NUDIX domain-containing protein [Coraliomargarita parva]
MQPIQSFQHCPKCGTQGLQRNPPSHIACDHCGHQYFINAASAVGAFILDSAGNLLLVRRAKDPEKGKLGLPGGFIDMEETAEDAILREVKEELNLELAGELEYIGSYPNRYDYAGITYPVLDFFFLAQVEDFRPLKLQESEIAGYEYMDPITLDLDEIAFPSMRAAIRKYRASRGR